MPSTKKTGKLAWKVDRNFETPREGDQGYATPVLIDFQDKPALLVYGAEHLTIHDVTDGKLLWQCGGFNPEKSELWPTIAMPVVVDDVAVVAAGRNDRKLPLLYGVKLDGSGDVSETNIIWKRDDIGTFVPCPAVWEGKVYLVRDQGEVECLNAADGTSFWRERFAKHRSKYYSSPLIAGGLLYCSREDGAVFVVDIRDGEFKLLAEAELKESVIASMVPLDKKVLVRSVKHLYCFGQ
ncbi:PQQ-binding-like beta-propeller repeat protein [bacterium]|nr:PQQ-binding-like beta-propeller repeat protein [bacterium]